MEKNSSPLYFLMPRKSVKILTGRGSFYATSKFARSLIEDGLARYKQSNPYTIQLTGAERVNTAYAPPGPFADELRGFIQRLHKLGMRKSKTRPGPRRCGSCHDPYRIVVPGKDLCSECWNEVVLLEKMVLGEVESIDELVGEKK